TASVEANAHVNRAKLAQRFHNGFELARFRYLDFFIHCAHIASFMFRGQPFPVIPPGPFAKDYSLLFSLVLSLGASLKLMCFVPLLRGRRRRTRCVRHADCETFAEK